MFRKKIGVFLILLSVLFLGSNISLADEPSEVEPYTKLVAFIDDNGDGVKREIEVPLKHTSVTANISGYYF